MTLIPRKSSQSRSLLDGDGKLSQEKLGCSGIQRLGSGVHLMSPVTLVPPDCWDCRAEEHSEVSLYRRPPASAVPHRFEAQALPAVPQPLLMGSPSCLTSCHGQTAVFNEERGAFLFCLWLPFGLLVLWNLFCVEVTDRRPDPCELVSSKTMWLRWPQAHCLHTHSELPALVKDFPLG